MAQVPPGLLANRYELQQRLSSSPAAEVYLAHDRDLDRPIAVKVLVPSLAADSQVVQEFRQAAMAAATVRDAHVVTVYDWGSDDAGAVFVAMEYVDGTNLADTLRESVRLSPERSADVGASIAEGLGAAHRVGVVHGGLTPTDVLLTRAGDVKLVDFGTAAAGLGGISTTSDVAAIYASPEQLQGRPADARSDLYALGVIVYEALAGQPPFAAADAVTLTERKLRDRTVPPSMHTPGVPPALDGIVLRLLDIDPTRRYTNASDVAADLHRLSATLAVPAAATAPVVVTGPEAPTSILPATAPGEPEPEQSHKTAWIVSALVVLGLVVAGLVVWAVSNSNDNQNARVTVPAVVGQPVGAAQAALTTAGLSPSTQSEPNDSFAKNLVFSQSPAADSKAPRNSVVILKVSAGPTTTTSTSTSTSTSASTSTTTSTTSTTTTTTTLPPTTTST